MSQPNPSTAMATALIDELYRCGVTRFVLSPGSRSAALAIAAADHPGIETVMVLDERSAAFYALGLAKAATRPTALISTSGTAPANYLPAIVEADASITPLVVLSADRPNELRGVGANQTIDQVELYGNRVRAFYDLAAPEPTVDGNDQWRSIAGQAVAMSLGLDGSPGPVHLNVAFREPTVPVSDDGRTKSPGYEFPVDGAANGRMWKPTEIETSTPLSTPVEYRSRAVVIAGDGDYSRRGLLDQAKRLGWPILATAQSGLRASPVVSAYHHILANGVPEWLQPDLVVAIGSIGPSTRLEDLFASAEDRVRVDRWGRTIDPRRNATELVAGDPVSLLISIENGEKSDEAWSARWIDLDQSVRRVLVSDLDQLDTPTSSGTAHAMNAVGWSTLVAGSSLPIREVDAHLTTGDRVIANRGASGIDGFNSTALGVATVDPGTVAVTGDLGFLHDSNGFINEANPSCVFVVIDNNGGGLFDGLPPAQHAPHYERLFVAPHNLDLEALAGFHGIGFQRVERISDLPGQVSAALRAGSIQVVHVPVSRDFDLGLRTRLEEIAQRQVTLFEA